jgi:hypothetical protein
MAPVVRGYVSISIVGGVRGVVAGLDTNLLSFFEEPRKCEGCWPPSSAMQRAIQRRG